jgi:tetratricopeptide (TPR) repeat protein
MLAKKNSIKGAIIMIALAVVVAGCTPAGPRAFLTGKKYLDRGDYANAAAQFKTAATLLATNAQVWNYYGVALQGDNQPQAAAAAYQRAIDLDRDLVEAHFNLGCLWLEQNQPDAARTEFTAYTLRRNNDPAGWLKLGSAQLRLGETVAAERSFSSVLSLKPDDAAAYNGLGLARIQRDMPRDAVKFFAAAVRAEPGFAAAILNLATVSREYLHDNKTALANYQAYLALTPHAADWDEVNALVNQLEQSGEEAPRAATIPAASAPVERNSPPPAQPRPYYADDDTRPAVSQKTPPPADDSANDSVYRPAPIVSAAPVQVVQVQPPPQIITSPRASADLPVKPAVTPAPAAQPPVEVPMPAEPEQNSGFWHRLFTPSKKEDQSESQYLATGVTPLPPTGSPAETANLSEASKPTDVSPPPKLAPVPLSRFPRYQYVSPRKPAPGNHDNGTLAAGAFTRAQLFEQDEKWPDAMQWYEQAAQADPSWFVAQYNTAVLAHRLRMYSLALPSYESALAIQPDSVDARYNFALALKAAGYVPDAINEFRKILASRPDEARAHLALANIYAQTLHDTALARRHYLKALELEPDSPQASDIRFWLAGNPG